MRIRDLCGEQPLYLRKGRTTTNDTEGWIVGQRSNLWSEGTPNKNLYEIFRGRIAKQAVETPSRLRRVRNWILWRRRHPPKWKREICTELEPDMRAPATPGVTAPNFGRENEWKEEKFGWLW
jgi:hypothetical protein